MPQFVVKMHRTVTYYAEVEVDADTERQARKLAKEKTEERGTWSDATYAAVKIDSVVRVSA